LAKGVRTKKATARAWFETLRDQICAEFERLEDEAPADLYPGEAGRFERTPWDRAAGGGGVMGMMHGRLFEKVGVHCSTVHGTFTPEMAKRHARRGRGPAVLRHRDQPDRHMTNPRVPAVHMNTRFIATTKSWFGGGGDLTPLLGLPAQQDFPDAIDFHAAYQRACDAHDPAWHPSTRPGATSISSCRTATSRAASAASSTTTTTAATGPKDFAFTQDVGKAFLESIRRSWRRRMGEAWTAEEREEQLVRRGRYVE
jgi:coproporphyrinogen III oxidase